LKSRGVLPDTCAWVEYFKPHSSRLKQELEHLIDKEKIFICGPIFFELVQGMRSDKEKMAITHALSALEYIEVSKELWIKAGDRASVLRREGKTIPFSDILIATIAVENGLSILTMDKHFSQIADVLLYSH